LSDKSGVSVPVSQRIEHYLSMEHVYYQIVPHPFAASSYECACAARLPPRDVVKSVMLRDRRGQRYAMALMPASNRLLLSWLPPPYAEMVLAREEEFARMFGGCRSGAVPGFGQAFEMEIVWDEVLLESDRLYFEGGDHEALVSIGQFDFRDLFGRYPHGVISVPETHHGDCIAGTLQNVG